MIDFNFVYLISFVKFEHFTYSLGDRIKKEAEVYETALHKMHNKIVTGNVATRCVAFTLDVFLSLREEGNKPNFILYCFIMLLYIILI